jgi:hypothetical protein
LAAVSIALALAALIASEYFGRRAGTRRAGH